MNQVKEKAEKTIRTGSQASKLVVNDYMKSPVIKTAKRKILPGRGRLPRNHKMAVNSQLSLGRKQANLDMDSIFD